MSDAKKCDRCGQFYDNLGGYRSRDAIIFKANSVMDLCPACYKDFKNWILFINERSKKDEQNDKND